MAIRNPKTGRFETSATTRARLAQEKAEAELAEIKAKQAEEEAKAREMSEDSMFEDEQQMAEEFFDEELYCSRGEQVLAILIAGAAVIALFALVWWVATQIRPYFFG